MLYKVPMASVIVTLDIIIWLAVVLAMAGPLILSGVYEALLDLRLLNFIDDRMGSKKSLSVQDKTVLVSTTFRAFSATIPLEDAPQLVTL